MICCAPIFTKDLCPSMSVRLTLSLILEKPGARFRLFEPHQELRTSSFQLKPKSIG